MKTFKMTTFGKYMDWYFGFASLLNDGKRMTIEDVTIENVTKLLSLSGYDVNDYEELNSLLGLYYSDVKFNDVKQFTVFLRENFNERIYIEEYADKSMWHSFYMDASDEYGVYGEFHFDLSAVDVVFNQEFDEIFDPSEARIVTEEDIKAIKNAEEFDRLGSAYFG